MRFRFKLTVFFSGVIVIVASLVTSLIYFDQKELLANHIKGEIRFQSATIMEDLDNFVFERQADISFLATDPVLRRRPFDAYRITERLLQHRETYGYYSSLSLFDLDRVRIADTSGYKLGERHPATEYWPAIEAGRDDVVISLSRSETEHTTVVHLATKVYDDQQEPTGVIVSRILLSDLLSGIQESLNPHNATSSRAGETHYPGHFTGYSYDIVDRQGNLIYSSGGRSHSGDKTQEEWTEVAKRLQNGRNSGSFQMAEPAAPQGGGQIVAFAHSSGVHDFPGTGWTTIIHVPTDVALSEIYELRDSTLLTFALVTLLALGAIPVFSRTVTSPVSELSRTVSEIGQGNLKARSSVSSDDEFGHLGRMINFMADEMQANKAKLVRFNEELSERVAEQTLDLRRANERLTDELAERHKAQKSLQDRVRLADFSAAIGVCVTSRKDLDAMLQACAETTVRHLGAAFARIWLLHEKEDSLLLRASAGIYTHLDGAHSRVPPEKCIVGEIASDRGPYMTNNFMDDPRIDDPEWARREKMVAFAGFPLLLGDELIGVLAIFSRQEIAEETRDVLGTASDFIAVGIRRIMSEKNLAESQDFLDKIINSVADPIFVKDQKHRFVLVNDAFCELSERPCDVLLYKTDHDFFPAEEADIFYAKDKEVLRSGEENINEEKVTDASGRTHLVVTKKKLHVDPGGDRFIVGIARDVTEQRRTEELIRHNEVKFRALAQTAVDAIILTEERGDTIFWNKGAEKMFGFTENEMLGRSIAECIPRMHREEHMRGMERVRSEGAAKMVGRTVEVTGRRSSGETFPIELSLNSWETEEEVFFSAIVRDISDRKRAEKARRESEERFRQLAETINEVFWLTSADKFEPIYISPAYETIWGRSCENWYERSDSWMDPIHPEDRERVAEASRALETSGEFDEEFRIIRPDGEVRWIRDRAFPVEDDEGEIYRIAGLAEDITERKEMENRLREISLRDELTGLYNRRGFATLAEQQLKVADRKRQATTLSFIDLDDMKGINDRFGHRAGDQALLETTDILLRTFRESDIIGRIGGDEFAVMSGEAGTEDSAALEKRLQRNLEEYRQQSEAEYSLELSMGTVDYQPGSSQSLEQLINKADKLMYEQKVKKKSKH